MKSHKILIFIIEFHYRLHKTTPFDPVRSRMNPASSVHHTVVSSTLILFSRLCFYLPSWFSPSSFTSIIAYVLLPCAMTCMCHIPRFRHCDGLWRPSNMRSLSVHVPGPVPGPLFSATQFLFNRSLKFKFRWSPTRITDGHFTRRHMCIYDHISHISSESEKYFR